MTSRGKSFIRFDAGLRISRQRQSGNQSRAVKTHMAMIHGIGEVKGDEAFADGVDA
jgi:hypothetical protein